MSRESAERNDRDGRWPAFAPDWAFFLDIDGTLLELRERPSAVVADRDLVSLLRDLMRGAGGAVALISGRAVADIERLFVPLPVLAAGQHGTERRDARGRLHNHAVPRAGLRHAAGVLAQFARERKGLLLEDKGLNLAVHYRAAPDREQEVEAMTRALAAELGPQFEVQQGKMVWEIKPSGRDKGSAIAEFMQEAPFAGRIPVFIGDDHTDEFGFEVVNRLGGHSVKVGAGDTRAGWRVSHAADVRRWLAAWMNHVMGEPRQ
ncbi:MAG: trehalose-phosphatase [Burkholderiales bacterium]